MVPKKGFDAYALFCVVRDVEQSGYNRLILKSDQENSIKDIISAVKRERAEDIDLLPELSVVGEHQMNGKVERAVQTMEGQIISMSLAVEMRYGVKIDESHPIWPWMVSYAGVAQPVSCYHRW
jgi:hypothetical protein